ncbi:glycerol dehydratase reactivase beta/small subunit family protein [Veillonella criceti]|uniref:Propanediol dehydratase medium subunit n=1 Tax=Veillonella criceti TaxID=103891 RepID=A0A380NMK5_9FIRM|nr:glycerol dehydratase reactivase beta/small subunit family protein [Veillonella criceti]SUP44288.1 Uncharacterised protein [Veillonella criceti]
MELVITAKPTIMIYYHQGIGPEQFQDVLYGIEEEGIPYTLEERAISSEVLTMADEASHVSALSVGLGCTAETLVLSYKNLPPEQFMYRLQHYKKEKQAMRALGANAARLVKGNPFKSDPRLEVAF